MSDKHSDGQSFEPPNRNLIEGRHGGMTLPGQYSHKSEAQRKRHHIWIAARNFRVIAVVFFVNLFLYKTCQYVTSKNSLIYILEQSPKKTSLGRC